MQKIIDKILDKISKEGEKSLTEMELKFLKTPNEFMDKYFSVIQFEEGGVYQTKNGDKIIIYGIEKKRVRFLLNDCCQDIKYHEEFLEFMNGKEFSIFD